jgi:hypothetical protein
VHFAAGAKIFDEKPLLVTDITTPIGIHERFRTLSAQDRTRYLGLSHVGSLSPLAAGTKIPDLSDGVGQSKPTRLEAYEASLRQHYGSRLPVKYNVDAAVRAVAIFENNCFKIRIPESTADAWAVFFNAGRLNHSCVPNCSVSWDRSTGMLNVYALRYILGDTELTIAYDECFSDPWQARREGLKLKYGFDCICEACNMASPLMIETEAKRLRMAEIQQLLAKPDPENKLKQEQKDNLNIEMFKLMAEQGRGTFFSANA